MIFVYLKSLKYMLVFHKYAITIIISIICIRILYIIYFFLNKTIIIINTMFKLFDTNNILVKYKYKHAYMFDNIVLVAKSVIFYYNSL